MRAAALLGAALLAGCSSTAAPAPRATGPVDVPAPSGTAGVERCADLVGALPSLLRSSRADLARRPVAGDPTRTAAWGDPPVLLVCGAVPPAGDPTAEQLQVGPPGGGLVTFVLADLGTSTAFTTVGLPVTVTVTVPDTADSTVLVPITPALLAVRP